MGLDMYLRATKSISTNEFDMRTRTSIRNDLYHSIASDMGLGLFLEEDSSYKWLDVEVQVAYWRKANHIHRWFVENVQHGDDNCLPHRVNVGHMTALRDLCVEVLDKRDPSLLPLGEGCFFGSSTVDDWYWEQTEYTRDRLTDLLELSKTDLAVEFIYRSSW